MKINVPLRRKDAEIEVSPCIAEKIIELSADLFNHFSENMLNDYDFIIENIDCMYQDINGVNHCLLVLGEGRDEESLLSPKAAHTPAILHLFPMPVSYGVRIRYTSRLCRIFAAGCRRQ